MFQVVWDEVALNDLAAVWVQANSATRQAITAATNLIDHELQTNPYDKGESREGDERVFFVHPLGIQFAIIEPQNRVLILHVWDIRRHK